MNVLHHALNCILFQKLAWVQTRSSPLNFVWLKIEIVFFFSVAYCFLSLLNKKCKTPVRSSIWILEDYCIFFYSIFGVFLSWHLRLATQLYLKKNDACEILDFSDITRLRKLRPGFSTRFPIATVGHQWEYCFSAFPFSFAFSCNTPADTLRPAPPNGREWALKGLFHQSL